MAVMKWKMGTVTTTYTIQSISIDTKIFSYTNNINGSTQQGTISTNSFCQLPILKGSYIPNQGNMAVYYIDSADPLKAKQLIQSKNILEADQSTVSIHYNITDTAVLKAGDIVTIEYKIGNGWVTLYSAFFNLAMRADRNLSELLDKAKARENLGLIGDVSSHNHDSRYFLKSEGSDIQSQFGLLGTDENIKIAALTKHNNDANAHAAIFTKIQDMINQSKREAILESHPVNSYYYSDESTSPAELFGGTWQDMHGMFLYASDAQHPAGTEGGENTHVLTVNELAQHNHSGSTVLDNLSNHYHMVGFNDNNNGYFLQNGRGNHNPKLPLPSGVGAYGWNGSNSGGWGADRSGENIYTTLAQADASGSTKSLSISNSGSNAAHNNMPKFRSVYCWKRIA